MKPITLDDLPINGWPPPSLPYITFAATVDGVDIYSPDAANKPTDYVGYYAVKWSIDTYSAYGAKTPRDLLPAGEIGDYIHAHRQLVR